MRRSWPQCAYAVLRGFPSEYDQVEQRVRTQAIRAMHRYARRLADRQETGHDPLPVGAAGHRFSMHIAGYAAHVVVDGRQHRDRFFVDIDAGKNACRFGDAGQTLLDDRRTQVLQMQVNVILEFAHPPALADFDGHRSADDVPGGEVFGIGRIALHESLAGGIGQITALPAGAFRDQAAGAVNAGGMKLHELHVLQGQACPQRHAAAITRAGVRRSA